MKCAAPIHKTTIFEFRRAIPEFQFAVPDIRHAMPELHYSVWAYSKSLAVYQRSNAHHHVLRSQTVGTCRCTRAASSAADTLTLKAFEWALYESINSLTLVETCAIRNKSCLEKKFLALRKNSLTFVKMCAIIENMQWKNKFPSSHAGLCGTQNRDTLNSLAFVNAVGKQLPAGLVLNLTFYPPPPPPTKFLYFYRLKRNV